MSLVYTIGLVYTMSLCQIHASISIPWEIQFSDIQKYIYKISHTGNTRPSRTCVIQEYRYYTMSLSQYHGCCQYHKSMSIPWVFANTMSPCLYHESMYKPWVHVCTISLIIYHESISIPWVFFKSMLSFLYHEKYSFKIYRNTNNKNKEIQISEL